jgi:glucose-6-phosphate 1-dehydrogenase
MIAQTASRHTDAFVLFGATGDLAHKKVLPALFRLFRTGRLSMPVIGVAKQGWTREQLVERARSSVDSAGDFDASTFEKFASQLGYLDGDYRDAATFQKLRKLLGSAQCPLHYMAIPPALFGDVVKALGESRCADGARLVIEKPFGRDLASAVALNRILRSVFPEEGIFRIDHFLGKEPVENLSYFRLANGIFEPIWNRHHVHSVQITMAEDFGIKGREAFYDQTGAIRDVFQNHLLQVAATLAMEPPARGERLRDKRSRAIGAMVPLRPEDVVRGQFRGYRNEPGVQKDSQVETFCAVRLFVDSVRWAGVPFFIRSGKYLPVTATEAHVIFKQPPLPVLGDSIPLGATYLRSRLGPNVEIAIGLRMKRPGEAMVGRPIELVADCSSSEEMTDYERLLGDAIEGEDELFATQRSVEAEWQVVDNVIANLPPVFEYEPGTWGPRESDQLIEGFGGWRNPRAGAGNSP